jgi:hypothetical protein
VIAGTGLVERWHRPRAELFADVPVEIEDGAPVLPELVLWACNLSEGDLLPVWRSDVSRSCRFESYLDNLETALDMIGGRPWSYAEQWLRQPMATVGPRGRLLLPVEAEALLTAPGEGVLVLRASRHLEDLFELAVEPKAPNPPVLSVEKRYKLPIVSGDRVILPPEALWVLGLPAGGRFACATSLNQADLEPASRVESLGDRIWIDLEPDGTLLLPPSVRKLLAEPSIRYERAQLTLSPSRLRLVLWSD